MNNQKTTVQFLMEHADRRPVSFHMPGHKGAELYRQFGYSEFLDKFMDCDVTEIPGADNLFQTEGVLRQTQLRYAQLYGVKQSYMLINGTSAGIIAAILASVPEGGQLIMARNCHKSVFNALTLGNLQPAYVHPELISEYGILGEVTAREIERSMKENPKASAVILPSPNYYGVCSDIKAIAEVVHHYGKVLIVDQAHGAHLKWLGKEKNGGFGTVCAEDAGADIIINSTHKTLASFTQSAVLNLNSDRVDRYELEDKLQAVQSTSPSYLLMASLDICADLLEQNGEFLMRQWNENLRYFYENIRKIPGFRVINDLERFDYSKINIDTSQLGITAGQLEEMLMERDIFAELTTGNILMLMTGIGNQRRDFDRLLHTLREICAELDVNQNHKRAAVSDNNAGMLPKKTQIFEVPKKKCRVDLSCAEGRICAASIIPYPPGIPLICPGEKIEKDDIAYISELRSKGEKVIGVNDEGQVTVGADPDKR